MNHGKIDISDDLDAWVARRRRLGIDPAPLPAGVVERKGRYQARAKVGGRNTYLGTYDTAAEAGAAVESAVAARPEAPARPRSARNGRGVYRTHHDRFVAKFRRGGVTVLVGTFGTEEEAAAAVEMRRGEVQG